MQVWDRTDLLRLPEATDFLRRSRPGKALLCQEAASVCVLKLRWPSSSAGSASRLQLFFCGQAESWRMSRASFSQRQWTLHPLRHSSQGPRSVSCWAETAQCSPGHCCSPDDAAAFLSSSPSSVILIPARQQSTSTVSGDCHELQMIVLS